MLKFLQKNDVFKEQFLFLFFFCEGKLKTLFFGIISLASSCQVLVLFMGL
jgi:hypothetical protein